jgi:ubiquinone biosynthesis protein
LEPAVRSRLGRPRTAAPVPEEALALHFRLALEELGPTFVKFGQVLSTRPDLLPPAYITELSRLQDEVPPETWEAVHLVLSTELEGRPEEIFPVLDSVPIAAASLSQVHAAQLADGTPVVVKVQRPNISGNIEVDLAILAELAAGAQHSPLGRLYDLPTIIEDFASVLRSELDYRREGRNADRFRASFADTACLHIPKVYWEYSTGRVLVMERLVGIKLDDPAGMRAAGLDPKQVADNSAEIIIKEVLEDGFFHADPHPGNFLVLADNVVGAMDFGMVGFVDDRLRNELIRLYVSAVNGDVDALIDQLMRMEAIPEDANRRRLFTDLTRLLNKYRGSTLKELRAAEIVSDILPIAFRHRLRLPSDLWLLAKTLNMMEGVGTRLDPDFDIFAVSEPIVKRLMTRVLLPNRQWRRSLVRFASDWGDVIEVLPRATSRILQQAERGELFTVHVKEADSFLSLLDTLVTRLALSVLLAGATIGLAMLIPATSGNILARFVTLAGFMASAAMSLWLAVSIIRGRGGK